MLAAGLLAVLSLLHIASSALGRRDACQSSAGADSVGESLLNSRQENYDRFEEVLVSVAKIGTRIILQEVIRELVLILQSSLDSFLYKILIYCVYTFSPRSSIHHCLFNEVTEVLDDGMSGPGRCPGDSDGEI